MKLLVSYSRTAGSLSSPEKEHKHDHVKIICFSLDLGSTRLAASPTQMEQILNWDQDQMKPKSGDNYSFFALSLFQALIKQAAIDIFWLK